MISSYFVDIESHLTCEDLSSVKLGPLVGLGAVKAVYTAKWRNQTFALSYLNNQEYSNDFKLGLKMLQFYQHSPSFVQLKGFCVKSDIILTEYHENGNALVFLKKMDKLLKPTDRIKFCIDYAKILKTLHNFNHVFCDSNDLDKLLSQLLVTKELRLILNDVDALADASDGLIRCGSQPLFGEFIAPEQRHPTEGYDYKTDLWKFASVCEFFISEIKFPDYILKRVQDIHSQCRNIDPNRRPSAEDLLDLFNDILAIVINLEYS